MARARRSPRAPRRAARRRRPASDESAAASSSDDTSSSRSSPSIGVPRCHIVTGRHERGLAGHAQRAAVRREAVGDPLDDDARARDDPCPSAAARSAAARSAAGPVERGAEPASGSERTVRARLLDQQLRRGADERARRRRVAPGSGTAERRHVGIGSADGASRAPRSIGASAWSSQAPAEHDLAQRRRRPWTRRHSSQSAPHTFRVLVRGDGSAGTCQPVAPRRRSGEASRAIARQTAAGARSTAPVGTGARPRRRERQRPDDHRRRRAGARRPAKSDATRRRARRRRRTSARPRHRRRRAFLPDASTNGVAGAEPRTGDRTAATVVLGAHRDPRRHDPST